MNPLLYLYYSFMHLTGYSSQSECDSDIWDQEVMVEQFSQKPLYLEIYQFQVSGKTPKYINNLNGRIYKQFSQTEHAFYELLYSLEANDPRASLKHHLPQYFGVQGIETLGKLPEFKKVFEPQQRQQLPKRNQWIRHISARNGQGKNNKFNQQDDNNKLNQRGENNKFSQQGKKDKCKFIVMRNLTYNFLVPNIIDLKLGTKKAKKSNLKFAQSTTNSHKFRINGMMVGLRNGNVFEQCFVSKYFGQSITFAQTQSYLSLFFFNGHTINRVLLHNIITALGFLIECFRQFKGAQFLSSSLFIAYDGESPDKYEVKLIDFDKYELGDPQMDYNILEGLNNIQIFLQNIVDKATTYEQILINRELQIFHHKGPVIPFQKIKKYQKASEKQTQEND